MTTTMNTKPLYEQIRETKAELLVKLSTFFPRTTFAIELISEKTVSGKFTYIALKWENDGIMNQLKNVLESMANNELWVYPMLIMTPKHMKLVEQKAKSMGMFGETVCHGWNASGAMYREEYSFSQLELANERLHYDIEFDFPIIEEIFQMAI